MGEQMKVSVQWNFSCVAHVGDLLGNVGKYSEIGMTDLIIGRNFKQKTQFPDNALNARLPFTFHEFFTRISHTYSTRSSKRSE